MLAVETWRWEFLGFESEAEGRPVQAWFDGLRIEAKEEIVDLVQHLMIATAALWRRPEYDPLDGEEGISELRPNDVRCLEGTITYRIYGSRTDRVYILLHGNRKGVRNDHEGKRIARERLAQLRGGKAKTHKFDFEGKRTT